MLNLQGTLARYADLVIKRGYRNKSYNNKKQQGSLLKLLGTNADPRPHAQHPDFGSGHCGRHPLRLHGDDGGRSYDGKVGGNFNCLLIISNGFGRRHLKNSCK